MVRQKKEVKIVEDKRFQEAEKCFKCKFYEHDNEPPIVEGTSGGLCLRNPPMAYISNDGIGSVSPPVDADGWCGEWKPKLNA